MIHYDFDLCCNEQCPKLHECKRYTTYKQGIWTYNYVMHGCVDGALFLNREIYHQMTVDVEKHKYMDWNVYFSETLTCKDSGEPIKVERIE